MQIDRAQTPILATYVSHDNLIEKPDMAGAVLSLPKFASGLWPELDEPATDSLVRYVDPTRQQSLFYFE